MYVGKNIFAKIYQQAQKILVYERPKGPARFVLDESPNETTVLAGNDGHHQLAIAKQEIDRLLAFAYELQALYEQAIDQLLSGPNEHQADSLTSRCQELEKAFRRLSPVILSYDSSDKPGNTAAIKFTLEENQNELARIFTLKINKDVKIRQFQLSPETGVSAMIAFMEGLSDKKLVDMVILGPIMLAMEWAKTCIGDELAQKLLNTLPGNQVKEANTFSEVEQAILSGQTALFLDGVERALIIDTQGWEHRAVDRPAIEQSIKGNQSAFTETLRVNISLIRAAMRTSDLITEIVEVGTRTKTQCAVMYLKSVTNSEIIGEVKKRLRGITVDYVANAGMLEQLITDHPLIPIPQTLSTERPDRVTPHLSEGRVAIFLEGSPFAIVVPFTFFGLYHSGEDYSMQQYVASFARVLRLLGTLLTTILPAVYLAISYYHQEAMPTELVLAIAGARERVPFPALLEVILMEISFELIREAGTRIPGMLGSTIGIVGAIIIGQAAVAANIVSPIMVVIVAVTGLASFAIPDYRMALGVRLTRFLYLFFAISMGLVGVAGGLLVTTLILCYMKSFGVPFMAPVAPKTIAGPDVVMRGPVDKQVRRPDELNTKDGTRQQPSQ